MLTFFFFFYTKPVIYTSLHELHVQNDKQSGMDDQNVKPGNVVLSNSYTSRN